MQRDPSEVTRVKAALAWTLANPGEDAELHALVDPVARSSGGDADVRSVASFLQALAAERRRAKESAAAATVRLRDERRAAEAQRQRAEALQEHATQLQQKLDAFTEIEKSLSDRQGTPH
jgi:septal ring factor EnvC (AmiA/AmiB activator)